MAERETVIPVEAERSGTHLIRLDAIDGLNSRWCSTTREPNGALIHLRGGQTLETREAVERVHGLMHRATA